MNYPYHIVVLINELPPAIMSMTGFAKSSPPSIEDIDMWVSLLEEQHNAQVVIMNFLPLTVEVKE